MPHLTISSFSVIKNILLLILVISGLHYAKEFLIPLIIGVVLATLFLPFCRWIELKYVSRGISTLICALFLSLIGAAILILLIWQISEITNDFTLIKQRAINIFDHFQSYIFNKSGVTTAKQTQLIKEQQPIFSDAITSMAGSFPGIIIKVFLTLVYFTGFLFYRNHIKTFLLKLVSVSKKEETEKVIHKVTSVAQQYLLGLFKMIVCLWIMYGIAFSLVGLKNSLVFALLCGTLEIVPFVGNIIGTIITVLMAAVQGAETSILISVVVIYGIVQFIQGWILEPLILGPQVKINPLFTIIALIIGELIWGIAGIVLAIPLIAMFKIVCDHVDSLKPYGFLIGEIESEKTEHIFLKKIKNIFKKTNSYFHK